MGEGSGNVLQFELTADLDAPVRARRAVVTGFRGLPVDLSAVELVVSEAVTNVVMHAYREHDPEGDPGRVRIDARSDSQGLTVTIEDDGAGMPPGAEVPSGGLGLTLIEDLCSGLEIESSPEGTRLTTRFAFGR